MNANTKPAVTPMSGEWLLNFAMYRAVLAAGFTVSSMKAMAARDGAHWNAVLSLNGKKVIDASNQGDGGPDSVDPVEYTDAGREAAKVARAKLLVLPEVHTFLLAFLVGVAEYEKDVVAREQKIAEILSKNEIPTNDDALGNVIATLAETRKYLPKFKKMASACLHWVPAGAGIGSTQFVKTWPDTPEHRLMAQKKWPEAFKDFQGFLADILEGL